MELRIDGREVWVHFSAASMLTCVYAAALLGADREEVLQS